MAATQLSLTQTNRTGVTLPTGSAADTTNGNSATNDGQVLLLADNTDTASHTVTISLPGKVDGQAVTSRAATVAAGATVLLGPYPPQYYGSTLSITCDSATVKLAALHVS